MKNIYLVLFVALFIFPGCKDNDVEPVSPHLGTYQYIETEDTLDFVRTVELREGNEVVEQGTVRNKGEANDLGYTYYGTGTYSLDGDRLTISLDFGSQKDNSDLIYVDKKNLIAYEDRLEVSEYEFADKYTKLRYLCPPNAFCVSPLPVYNKVNLK